jgi:hypothetical protein
MDSTGSDSGSDSISEFSSEPGSGSDLSGLCFLMLFFLSSSSLSLEFIASLFFFDLGILPNPLFYYYF